MALQMMPRVTNLLTANQSNMVSGWGDALGGEATISYAANKMTLEVTAVGGMTATRNVSCNIGTPAYNSTLWGRAKIKVEGITSGYFRLRVFGDGVSGSTFTDLTTNGDYEVFTSTVVPAAPAWGPALYVYIASGTNQGAKATVSLAQAEIGSYPTLWQIGGTPRTAQKLSVTTPAVLPSDCGIGCAVKMDLASTQTGLPSMTFARQGAYHLYMDAADKKLKCTNGTVTAMTSALTWAAGDTIDGYGGRIDGKIFVNASINGAAAVYAETTGDHVDSGSLLYVAERNVGLSFDGVDDVVTVNDYAGIRVTTQATWEWWMNLTTYTASAAIFDKYVLAAGSRAWRIRPASTQIISIQLSGDGNNNEEKASSEVTTVTGLQHWAMTYNAGVFNAYQNGVDIGTAGNFTITTMHPATSALEIGRRRDGFYNKGNIWDARIWNTARTQTQIHDNMHKRLNGNETGLVGYWPMDACTGSTVANLVSGGNNGTITGAVWNAEQPVHGKVYNVRRDIIRSIVAAKLGVS